MKIIENNLSFGTMSTRKKTEDIVLHHAAALICTIFDIHRWHKENGWAGVGYHFFVRKNGEIHRGRPINTVGAHAQGYNSNSIGICFEGNFEKEKMTKAQEEAGKWLVAYVKQLYPTINRVVGHRDLMATACPGKNFPFDEIAKGKKITYQGAFPAVKVTYYKANSKGKKVKKTRYYLKQGDTGIQVKRLQMYLNWYGNYNLVVDGDYGEKTARAVRDFRKKTKLTNGNRFGKGCLAKSKTIKK